jgi:transcription elongation factor GreA
VGPEESDIGNGKISVSSPLGRAMLGKRPAEEVTVQAPGGKRVYEIVDIE